MYMNGRGPMMGGHRGPMGGPMGGRRGPMMGGPMGFGPMHRPMGMHSRPMGLFPLGGLMILPALMFGGWIVVAVLSGILGVVGSIVGGVFEGLASLSSGAFSGGGLVLGIFIGLAAYYWFRKRNAATASEKENINDRVA